MHVAAEAEASPASSSARGGDELLELTLENVEMVLDEVRSHTQKDT